METTETTLIGASRWEQDLYRRLIDHEVAEEALIARYRAALERSESEAFKYLLGLIIEDEERHHRFTEEIANALRANVELTDVEPRVPLLMAWKPVDPDVLEATEEFLKIEEEDARELKKLAKEMRDTKDTTIWHLLVTLMAADTEKHQHILSFLRHHLRAKI